jgi:hypothetical protein
LPSKDDTLASKWYVDRSGSAFWVSLTAKNLTISGDKGFVSPVHVGITSNLALNPVTLLVNANANNFAGSLGSFDSVVKVQRNWPNSGETRLFDIRNCGIVDKQKNSCVRALLGADKNLTPSAILGSCILVEYQDNIGSSVTWDKQETIGNNEFENSQSVFTASVSGVYLVVAQAAVLYQHMTTKYDPITAPIGFTTLEALGLVIYKNGQPYSSNMASINTMNAAGMQDSDETQYATVAISDTVYLDATDTIQIYIANQCAGNPIPLQLKRYFNICTEDNADGTFLNIYKII